VAIAGVESAFFELSCGKDAERHHRESRGNKFVSGIFRPSQRNSCSRGISAPGAYFAPKEADFVLVCGRNDQFRFPLAMLAAGIRDECWHLPAELYFAAFFSDPATQDRTYPKRQCSESHGVVVQHLLKLFDRNSKDRVNTFIVLLSAPVREVITAPATEKHRPWRQKQLSNAI
jgi:hypothetical protein